MVKRRVTDLVTRSVVRHKVYGTVIVVERDDTGEVLAASEINPAVFCKHNVAAAGLSPDTPVIYDLNKHRADYEPFELQCSDPTHLLADIAEAERECMGAEAEYEEAKSHAKALKETYEEKQAALRACVRNAVAPKPLPLLDLGPQLGSGEAHA